MVLTKSKKRKPPPLTKEIVASVFDTMRQAIRNAPHRVPTFKEIDAEFEPILAKMEIELEEERQYLKEHGRYPGEGVVGSKGTVEAQEKPPGGVKIERSGKKGPKVRENG